MGLLASGHKAVSPGTLFPRIDLEKFNIAKDSNLKVQEKALPEKKETAENIAKIEYTDFAKVELCVAKILTAKKAENAEKLLLLTIDAGEEKPRELVAGIAKWYSPEELVGKNIIIVSNLAEAKIRGHLSQGMLLAAEDEMGVSVLTVSREMKPGSRIK
jgi:methionyl-tRNA synthetase